MYFVYVLFSEGFGKHYTGQTNNIKRRLALHNEGKVKSSRPYMPYRVVCLIRKDTRAEALILERKIKNLKSGKRFRAFIKKYNELDLCRSLNLI